ncbi:MAG: MBL fold metallo-hydrolase [Deltaproteobacteria bacterium]|nr:MBL fold metallo-hydrolase [Deltaproteobacteria bacterium]
MNATVVTATRRANRSLATILVTAAAALAVCVLLPPGVAAQQPVTISATDGYFDVSRIDADTWAISEPQYWQKNNSFIIKGQVRTILFDTGSGTRDIKHIADNVTRKPTTALPSHVHYDHIGSVASFDEVAMIDLPVNREHTADNRYTPSLAMSLSPAASSFMVTEWWRPGEKIDIGGRVLEAVWIPGHSPDSIAVIDRARGYAFIGDFLYAGELYTFLPGADLAAYLESTKRLLADYPEVKTLLCGHMDTTMPRQALVDLQEALTGVLEQRAPSQRVWWLGGLVRKYPGRSFSILAW